MRLVQWHNSRAPGSRSTRPGAERPRELDRGGTGTEGRRWRARGSQRQRRTGSTRTSSTVVEEAWGGVRQGRLATRNTNQRSLKTEQHDYDRNRDDGCATTELHSDDDFPSRKRGQQA